MLTQGNDLIHSKNVTNFELSEFGCDLQIVAGIRISGGILIINYDSVMNHDDYGNVSQTVFII